MLHFCEILVQAFACFQKFAETEQTTCRICM